ncbi:unnamed protein product [Umbelopsis ramanniana]
MATSLGNVFKYEPHVVREKMAKFWNKVKGAIPMTEVGSVTETSFQSIDKNDVTLRVYTPEGTGPFPAVVFYHGGGFVLCSLDTHDFLCRAICKKVQAVVISVDYRLAPEAKYPKGVEDAYAALCHVYENASKFNIDSKRIAVAGDSAGGNLSTVTSILSKERNGPPIIYQCLIYPTTDFAFHGKREKQGKVVNKSQTLSNESMNYFGRHYLNKASEAREPYASPLRAKDLSNLPPAMIITAEHDILKAEGQAYGERLKEAGVDCQMVYAVDQDHGFLTVYPPVDDRVNETFDAMFTALKNALHASPKAKL